MLLSTYQKIQLSKNAPYGTTHLIPNASGPIYFSLEHTTGAVYRYLKNPNGWVRSNLWEMYEFFTGEYDVIRTKYAPTNNQLRKHLGVTNG